VNLDRTLILECESREPDLASPRICRIHRRFSAGDRDDYWLAEVSPPFLGQHFGLGGEMLDWVVLATKFRDSVLFEADSSLVPVYVAYLADRGAVASGRTVRPEEIRVILWGWVKLPAASERPLGGSA